MLNTTRTALGLVLAAAAFTAPALGQATATSSDQFVNLPDTMVLQSVIRDFKSKAEKGGHPDFESYSGSTTVNLVKDALDSDGKPVVNDLRGKTITKEYTNKAGKNINPALYNAALGDKPGTLAAGGTGNGLTSAADFAKWYRDTPGTNVSKVVPLTLKRVTGTNRFVFDSATDEPYKSRGGFFPVNGELFGNFSSTGKNFHFTTELETEFVFEKGKGQVFTFTGDDDVWVYVDGKLVIDLGGLHSKKEQTLELDRLSWLQDGQAYKLKVFHAERRTNESNFRIETTLKLRSVEPPATGGQWD